jgi:hypothetical protein
MIEISHEIDRGKTLVLSRRSQGKSEMRTRASWRVDFRFVFKFHFALLCCATIYIIIRCPDSAQQTWRSEFCPADFVW